MKYIGKGAADLCLFLNIFVGAFGLQERILINKGYDTGTDIPYEIGSFYTQVATSSFMVDKSLFIENLANGSFKKVNIITFPRRWGKTTNMKMLELFLNTEFDEKGDEVSLYETVAYKLFVNGTYTLMENEEVKTIALQGGPFLISENKDVVNMYLGQYPVIFFSFLSLSLESFDRFKESFKFKMIDTFRKHKFLRKKLQNLINENEQVPDEVHDDLDAFNNCYSLRRMDKMIPEFCIRTLSRLLYEHSGKKVFILFDEYDYVYNNLLFNKQNVISDNDEHLILEFISKFMISTFKDNEYFKCGIITGIIRIAKAELSPALSMSKEFNVFSPEINSFYGFTQSEMNTLMTEVSKFSDAEIKQAELQYAYHMVDSHGKHIKKYNPFAAVLLVESKKFNNYWTAGAFMLSFLLQMFTLQTFRNEVQNLVASFNTSSSFISKHFRTLSFNSYEYKCIGDLLNNADIENLKLLSTVDDNGVSEYFLKLLFFTGYLSGYLVPSVVEMGATLNLSIPNTELLLWFKVPLEDYYAGQLCTEPIDLYNIGVEFMKIIDSPSHINLNSFKVVLEAFLRTRLDTFIQVRPKNYISVISYNHRKGQNPNEEDYIHANEALLQAILTAGTFYTKCLRKGFDIRLPEQHDRPDLLFINRTNVIILELKYCFSAYVSLEQAKKYARLIYRDESIFDHVIVSNVVFYFICINVNKDNEVHILHGEEKWLSHNKTHYSSINETHQITFDDVREKKCWCLCNI